MRFSVDYGANGSEMSEWCNQYSKLEEGIKTKRVMAIVLVGMLVMSSIAFAAPKETKEKDISNRVIVFEEFDKPDEGQNTTYVKFPNLGNLDELTVERIRVPEMDNTSTDYINDSDLSVWEGGYEVVADKGGNEWIVLDFYYTRDNVHQSLVKGMMTDNKKNFTYSFTYDSMTDQKTIKNSKEKDMKEKEMKDISEKLIISEDSINDEQSEVMVKFPKMGSELAVLTVTRERTNSFSTTITDYLNDDIMQWWEGEYEVITEEDKEYIILTFVYTHGNIESFDIQVEMIAGNGGIAFDCDYSYQPENWHSIQH